MVFMLLKQCSNHSSFLSFVVYILILYLSKTDLHCFFDKFHISEMTLQYFAQNQHNFFMWILFITYYCLSPTATWKVINFSYYTEVLQCVWLMWVNAKCVQFNLNLLGNKVKSLAKHRLHSQIRQTMIQFDTRVYINEFI